MRSLINEDIKQTTVDSRIITAVGSLCTATLLITAYLFTWLGWLAWIALVPFILVTRGKHRLTVYIHTLIVITLYFIVALVTTGLWSFVYWNTLFILMLLICIALVAESRQLSNWVPDWGWIIAPLFLTGFILMFGVVNPSVRSNDIYQYNVSLPELLTALVGIVPVSQRIYERIAGTYWEYFLLLTVLVVNHGAAELLLRCRRYRVWFINILIIVSATIGLYGSPIRDLPISTPAQQGMDAKVLQKMGEKIPEIYSDIRSVIVVRHGTMVFERNYANCSSYTLNSVESVTKSFTSALMGIAIRHGDIRSVQEKVGAFFPENTYRMFDPKMKQIRIKHLLTMTSGLEDLFNTRRTDYLGSQSWIAFTLKSPVNDSPGALFNYNNAASHLLSGIIHHATGRSLVRYADQQLFGPLGISRRIWVVDPRGNNFGAGGLYLRARDMAKFGQLYLNGGVWEGRRIIPEDWIRESTRRQSVRGVPPFTQNYGYLFWVTNVKGYDAFYAFGYGGQYVYAVPRLDLVVVITSERWEDRAYERFIPAFIFPAIKKLNQGTGEE